ncbi:MAG: prolipoprotein diacylglyceryl transferase [Firmicutes bacterium]|nr:prolipoprotein diacylglyceryl transferase [Bacillota bacterium]
MDSVFLDLGFIQIYWYSIMIFLGLLFGGWIILRESRRFGISEDFIINLFFFAVPISIIGARLYYVVFNWSYYSSNLLSIFKIWEGGLAIHGGLLFGLIWIILYTRKYKVNTFRILDMVVVGLLLGQAIGRWGNFFNGEAHGPITTLEFLNNLHLPNFIIEGMNIGGTYYQPTFLYESLWCLVGFLAILFIRRLKYIKIGQITGIYLIWYGIGRFLIESLRTDSLMLFGLKQAQLVSVFMVVAGIIIIIVRNRGSKLENQYNKKGDINEIRF